MTRTFALLLICALPAAAMAAEPSTDKSAKPASTATAPLPKAAGSALLKSEDDKTLFAIGEIVSSSVKAFGFTERERQIVQAGFAEGIRGTKQSVNSDEYRPKIQALLTARLAKGVEKAKAEGKAYRAKAATAKDTTTTASGLIMTTVKTGTGPMPAADDQVKVHYEGRLIDGTVFDSSIQRGQPATFKLSGVVPCWTEALQHMSVGGKSKLVCPAELAYGDHGSPPKIPGGSTLVFDVELLDIVKAEAPPPAAQAAPATAPEPAAPAVPATPASPK